MRSGKISICCDNEVPDVNYARRFLPWRKPLNSWRRENTSSMNTKNKSCMPEVFNHYAKCSSSEKLHRLSSFKHSRTIDTHNLIQNISSLSRVWSAEQFAQLFHRFCAEFREPQAVDERVQERIQQYKRAGEFPKTLGERRSTGNWSERSHTQEREVTDQEEHVDQHYDGRCSPVPLHVQCSVSRLLLRLAENSWLSALSSQTAVDFYAQNGNDQKDESSGSGHCRTTQFTVQQRREGQEQRKNPDEGEHCTNSPGRHNLLILEVEKKSGVSVQADRCQSQERSAAERGRRESQWQIKCTRRHKVWKNCLTEENCAKLRHDNWTGSEVGHHERAEQKLGRQANGRDATHRQQNHKVGEGCGDGQCDVKRPVYKTGKWIVQSHK